MKLPGVRIEDRAARSQLVFAGAWEDERPFLGLLSHLDWKLAGRLHRLAKSGALSGKEDELRLFLGLRPLHPLGLVILGLGPKRPVDGDFLQRYTDRVAAISKGLGNPGVILELPCPGHTLAAQETDRLVERYGAWQIVAQSTADSFAPLARTRPSMRPREVAGSP